MTKRSYLSVFALLVGTAILFSCGNKNSAQNVSSVDDLATKSGLGNIACDGEGTEFSGSYTFNYTQQQMTCTPQGAPIQHEKAAESHQCIQNNKEFICHSANTPSQLKGCIGKDGRFKLSLVNDSSLSMGMTVRETAVGTIGQEDGTLEIAWEIKGRNGSVSCKGMSRLSVMQGIK